MRTSLPTATTSSVSFVHNVCRRADGVCCRSIEVSNCCTVRSALKERSLDVSSPSKAPKADLGSEKIGWFSNRDSDELIAAKVRVAGQSKVSHVHTRQNLNAYARPPSHPPLSPSLSRCNDLYRHRLRPLGQHILSGRPHLSGSFAMRTIVLGSSCSDPIPQVEYANKAVENSG
jgi:hypothetical protein